MSIWNSLSRGIGRRFGGRGETAEFNNLWNGTAGAAACAPEISSTSTS